MPGGFQLNRVIGCTGLVLWTAVHSVAGQSVDGVAPKATAEGRPSKYLIDTWQTEDGLPQNSVTALVQTRDGYVWMTTFTGLVRFDGVGFTVFDRGNTPALKSSRLIRLFEDRGGTLWIISEFGDLTRLREGRFEMVTAVEGLPASGAGILCEDAKGVIWLADRSGELHRWDHGKFRPVPISNTVGGPPTNFVIDREGQLWVGQKRGYVARTENGRYVRVTNQEGHNFNLSYLAPARDGGVWVATYSELQKLKTDGQPAGQRRFPVSGQSVTTLCEEADGTVWLGTYGGGLLLCEPSGVVTQIGRVEDVTLDLVLSLCKDREGNLWIGTNGRGLNRMKPRVFEVYDIAKGVTENIVMSVTEDREGGVWLGMNGGGVNVIRSGQVFKPVRLPINFIWSVLGDVNGGLWIGSYGAGVGHYNGSTVEWYRIDPRRADELALALYQDRQGVVWVGGNFGVARFAGGHFATLPMADGLSQNDVRALAGDTEGNLYIGTMGGGLNRFRQDRFQVFTQRDGLADDHIWSLYSDADDVLWIGTFGGGLSRFKAGRFTNYSVKDGLHSKVISSILEDNGGNLWMSSNRGIFRVSKRQLNDFAEGRAKSVTCFSYGRGDGLGSIDTSGGCQPAGWKARDGRLWFATVKGVAVVDPSRMPFNSNAPPVAIEEVLVDNEPVLNPLPRPGSASGPASAQAIRVPYEKERIEFHYSGLSFTAPEKVRFKFRLEGLERNWVDAGSRRTAYFTHVPPGEYRFQVIACNNDGIWNETGDSLALVVVPPLWQRWWFLAVCALTLATAGGVAVRYVYRARLHRELELLEQQSALEKERARIANDIHDDLGARLTQIGLLSELARRQTAQPDEVQAHVSRIAENTRGMVQAMDEIVWAVDPSKDSIDNLADYLAPFAQEFFQGSPVRCRLDFPEILPAIPLSAEARHGIFLVLKEALNNVVKHSAASEVWLRLSCVGTILEVVVEDNGRGLERARLPSGGHGNGLRNMEKRIEALGGAFELTSQPGQGTRICLRVDLSKGRRQKP
jgi:ligand-binding sensor domain-containing protein/signal transduction histidine kinase